MKQFFTFVLLLLGFTRNGYSQNVAINTDGSLPNANAMLDIQSSSKGLLIPRTSSASRAAIVNTKGLLIYDTTVSAFWFNDGSNWLPITGNAASLAGTTNYVPKFTASSAVGNSQIVDNGQYVGIGTTTPTAGLTVIHNGGIIAKGDTGTNNQYTLTETGAGAKFIWHPKKGAIRAGYIDNGYGFLWDDQYIGNWSTGFGYNEFATGTGAVAIGYSTASQGSYSFSSGVSTMATRTAATAMGNGCKAEGDYSFAAGNGTTAVGISSFALGNLNATQGDYSFALGYNCYSGGTFSLAMGNAVHATGIGATGFGGSTIAAGNYSFAAGQQVNAGGLSAAAVGYLTNANGPYSFAAGNQTNANGNSSAVSGYKSTANGVTAVALGYNAIANGDYSVAEGLNVTAGGTSAIAFGQGVTAGGPNSFVWGQNSNTTGRGSLVLGINLFDGGHKGNAMLGDTDPWNAGSVGSSTDDQMICRFNNGYYFLTGGNTNRTGIIATHGDNSWSLISDSTKKEKIIPVDGEALLHKISVFRLSTWNYKGQDPKTYRHYGPMAQDFHNAFGHDAIGAIGCDTLINEADFLGVSFTAIQALEKRTQKIEQLQRQNAQLVASNEKLALQLQEMQTSLTELHGVVEALVQSGKRNHQDETVTAINR